MSQRKRTKKPTSVTGDAFVPEPSEPNPQQVHNAFDHAVRVIQHSHNQITQSIIYPINKAIETLKTTHYRLSGPILDPIIKARTAVDNALSQIHTAAISPLMRGLTTLQPIQDKLVPNTAAVNPTYYLTTPVEGSTIEPEPGKLVTGILPTVSPETLPPGTVNQSGDTGTLLPMIQLRTSVNPNDATGLTPFGGGGIVPPPPLNAAPDSAAAIGIAAAANNDAQQQVLPPGLAGSCPNGKDPVELIHAGETPNGDWVWNYPDGTQAEITGSYLFPVRLFKCEPENGKPGPIAIVNPNNPPQPQANQPCIPICPPPPQPCSPLPSKPSKPSKPAKPVKGNPEQPGEPQQPQQPDNGGFPSFVLEGCDIGDWSEPDWLPCCSTVNTTDVQGSSISEFFNQLISWFTQAIEGSGIPFAGSVGSTITDLATPLVTFFTQLLSGIGLDSGEQARLVLERMILGLVNKHSGGALRESIDRVDYALNATYPHILPSAEMGIGGYITGVYSYDTCRCLWNANGRYEGYLSETIEMERRKTNVQESLVLYRKGDIDETELEKRIRRNGWIQPQDIAELKTLNTQIPGISELITYMIRDAADKDVVEKFKLDTHFTDKYVGQVKAFAKQQGIHDDYAKLAWRSHWMIPPPSTLYEMLHRLRNNPQFGGPDQMLADVKAALEQQDILPFWIDRLLEIAYHPINRIDAQRGYEFGAFDDQDLIAAYNAQGYTDDITDKLVAAAKLRVIDKLKTNPFLKGYAAGWINSDELTSSLGTIGYPQQIIEKLKEQAVLYENLEVRKALIQGIIDKYVKGGSDESELEQSLKDNGLDEDQISFTLEMALGRRQAQVKHVPAADWIKWLVAGYVQTDDATTALLRLGYNWDDIHRMISAAMEDSRKKDQLKEAKKLAAQEKTKEQQYLREQRLEIQQQKAAQTEELRKERLALRLQQMEYTQEQRSIAYQNKLNAARRAKAKQTAAIRLLEQELIGNVSKKTGVDVPTATNQVKQLISHALIQGSYYKQEAIAGLSHLITIWTSKIGVEFPTFARAIIDQGALTSNDALNAWKESPQYQPPAIP